MILNPIIKEHIALAKNIILNPIFCHLLNFANLIITLIAPAPIKRAMGTWYARMFPKNKSYFLKVLINPSQLIIATAIDMAIVSRRKYKFRIYMKLAK
jgi:hypothetical protein